jgi:UDP-2,4-diacetamido-2,4,6-trideoxy-beta-L-altropyranose hydrolase
MRCLALSQALKAEQVEVGFICASHPGFDPAQITDLGFDLDVISVVQGMEDAKLSSRIVQAKSPDWLVVDHYGLGIEWERYQRPYTSRLMVIEDLANRPHAADMLLDQNLRADSGRAYEALLPANCLRLLGPEYALLRPQFFEARKSCKTRTRIPPRILLFMGGGDEQNVTMGVLKLLQESGSSFSLQTVVGQAHPAKESIQRLCHEQGWGFHCQVANMAALMVESDLAIGAGGVSSWERCTLGLPTLIITLSENQAENADMLERSGAAISLGWWNQLDSGKIRNVLGMLNSERLSAMSQAASALVDGRGAMRVAEALLKEQGDI